MAELAASNWSAVARTYGVSDNAVRKWVRWYEADAARREVADREVVDTDRETGGDDGESRPRGDGSGGAD